MTGSPETLQAELARESSATVVLQRHCDRLTGGGVPIRAHLLPVLNEPTIPNLREHLAVDDSVVLGVRHVSLRCNAVTLSDAWNWYVVSRLSPEMNKTLQQTDMPFGRVVSPLHFHRQTLDSRLANLPNDIVLQNSALLRRQSDNAPIAFVLENYRGAILR